jgi:hypothetical protein
MPILRRNRSAVRFGAPFAACQTSHEQHDDHIDAVISLALFRAAGRPGV